MSAIPRPDGGEQPSLRRYLDQPRIGPTALRIVLGARLRRLRQECDITRVDAGKSIRASDAKITRLERGQVGFKQRDVADLLSLYGVLDETERADYTEMARQANLPGWWHQYSDVLEDWFELHVGLEEAASLIRSYEVQFLPGLLQTGAYARVVTTLGYPDAPASKIDRLVELRLERQKLLHKPEAPTLWAVLDEAVLRRPFGGPEVMRPQLEHLIAMAALPNVTLQIAPFSVGALAAAGTPVTLLRFAEPDLPDKIYLEQLTGAIYLDKQEEIDQYSLIMDRLSAEADPPQDTVPFLRSLLDALS
ncbi:helix-turn-helix domain-containing protein [Streptomyces fuscigenes]|uniref:helix-turn-helix domain-containing protein n=1 Tax=Streptomyces fuscigenes TaxID=1528880 RepID=UPI001F1A205D|nr:helix-turn-helix transcriptional regulator [Streptomyces fuscigenes]MCF3962512.1 helix-turn-helix domain-containing protein [Streptomyces fuscigenes]